MKKSRVLWCRVYQQCMGFAMHFLSFKEPEVVSGSKSMLQVPSILRKRGFLHPLVVTDAGLSKLGMAKPLLAALSEAKIDYEFYDGAVPNPTFQCIEEAKMAYLKHNCDAIIALGGGSSMDTAKAAGALLANPKKSLSDLRGNLHVTHRFPLLIAIPTTAGTGSEATVAAVVVNESTHEKFSINDPHLIPGVAILDSDLLAKLPPSLIASTGMDALTHAVESYIGSERTAKSKRYALEAIGLIFQHLYDFYLDSSNVEARDAMQLAAYKAGVSFTRSYVGYVHALAHALGGAYNVPHGLANAILLPHVLKRYGEKAARKLSKCYDAAFPESALGDGKGEEASRFILAIEELNKKMGIPDAFHDVIKEADIPLLAKRADHEGNPLYPVPLELDEAELASIYKEVAR